MKIFQKYFGEPIICMLYLFLMNLLSNVVTLIGNFVSRFVHFDTVASFRGEDEGHVVSFLCKTGDLGVTTANSN